MERDSVCLFSSSKRKIISVFFFLFLGAMQYLSEEGLHAIGRLIEKAVADAEASGARVLTLGLLNQVHAHTSLDCLVRRTCQVNCLQCFHALSIHSAFARFTVHVGSSSI
jgi:hypothetical protein